MVQIAKYCTPFVMFVLMTACVGHKDEDDYLKSLNLPLIKIVPEYKIDLSDYGFLQPLKLIKYNDWLIIKEYKSSYQCEFFNTITGERFGIVPKGRGPGEMMNMAGFYRLDNNLILTETNLLACIAVDLEKTIGARRLIYDTIGVYRGCPAAFGLNCEVKDGMVSPSPDLMIDYDVWYSLWDKHTGETRSSVLRTEIPGLEKLGESAVRVHNMSVQLASNHNDKVCVAMVSAAIVSFASVSNGTLHEVKRIVHNLPVVAEKDGHAVISSSESKRAFQGVTSDQENVYLLYSGRMMGETMNSEIPSWEANNLVVYDWDGNPKCHYYLENSANSVFVEGDCLYCTTTYPDAAMYVYRLR